MTSNRWCIREHVEHETLKERKINLFKIIDTSISSYFGDTNRLPPKYKSSFCQLKQGIQDFHMKIIKYV